MSTSHIVVEIQDRVMQIRMRRPEKKNALTTAMYEAMGEAVTEANRDDGVRAVVIAGTDDCFTAGNDLDDFRRRADAPNPGRSDGLAFIETLIRLDKPLLASVKGLAIGIGTTMLLHCDFVYAGESARLRTPFVDLGLCPEASSSLLLPLIVGPRRANEMLLMGRMVEAHEAAAWGLVNEVKPDPVVDDHTLESAVRLASKPTAALMHSKRLLKRTWGGHVARVLDEEREIFSELLQSDDARAILDAFFNRG